MGSRGEHQHPIGADFWTFSNGRLDEERENRGSLWAFHGISCPLA